MRSMDFREDDCGRCSLRKEPLVPVIDALDSAGRKAAIGIARYIIMNGRVIIVSTAAFIMLLLAVDRLSKY